MSPRTNSHLGGDRVLSPRETSRQLAGEIAMLRDELGGQLRDQDAGLREGLA